MSAEQLKALERFSACDVSDALLKLKPDRGGFIPDLHLRNKADAAEPIIASVSTVLFLPKGAQAGDSPIKQKTNIPEGAHYVDSTPTARGQAVLMSAPPEVTCAVLGGIMALRMSLNGASAIVVDGRVRDLDELRGIDIPVWSMGTSVVGTGAGAVVWAKDVQITMNGITVLPGDIVCADPYEQGVVVIPQELLDEVLELCPRLVAADEKVIEAVRSGSTVKDAFAKHRQGL